MSSDHCYIYGSQDFSSEQHHSKYLSDFCLDIWTGGGRLYFVKKKSPGRPKSGIVYFGANFIKNPNLESVQDSVIQVRRAEDSRYNLAIILEWKIDIISRLDEFIRPFFAILTIFDVSRSLYVKDAYLRRKHGGSPTIASYREMVQEFLEVLLKAARDQS